MNTFFNFSQINFMKNKSIFILFCLLSLFSLPALILPSFAETKENSQQTVPVQDQSTIEVKEQVQLYKDNWFDFVNEFWEKYSTTATVIDIETGKTYEVIRVGGYNHADVEPIDSYNTDIMYSIYDDTWQWTRRPVWVKIKGRYIAASINGYPHAYDYISGNNMTGHTCIHFYKSRTHGTNNWDPDHKTCVEIAFSSKSLFDSFVGNS